MRQNKFSINVKIYALKDNKVWINKNKVKINITIRQENFFYKILINMQHYF